MLPKARSSGGAVAPETRLGQGFAWDIKLWLDWEFLQYSNLSLTRPDGWYLIRLPSNEIKPILR